MAEAGHRIFYALSAARMGKEQVVSTYTYDLRPSALVILDIP